MMEIGEREREWVVEPVELPAVDEPDEKPAKREREAEPDPELVPA